MAAQALELARAWGQKAVEARTMSMRPLEAHCRLGLGRLYSRSGRRDEAHAELTAAVTILRALRMTRWLREAEAALAT